MSFRFPLSRYNYWLLSCLIPGLVLLTLGCGSSSPGEAKSESSGAKSSRQEQKSIAVDVAVAKSGSLQKETQYVGTTFPVREVALRSRTEGQIIDLTADVGDRVEKGQVLARIDDSISASTVIEAEAEVAALESEVASLSADINDARALVEQAQLELKQAQSDAARTEQLSQEGAVSEQEAELSRTAVGTAQQALQSAQQQVQNRASAVVAAQRRVAAQEAIVAQERQRQSFTVLTSPITGSVLARVLESGDLAQVGNEVLRLGDFSQIEVRVQVSELELAQIRKGEAVRVKLDAFPEQTFTGEVTQISLAADATARLIPVEVTIPNTERRIGRGLLARVNFSQQNDKSVVVPETAVQVGTGAKSQDAQSDSATIFVLKREGERGTVIAREVQLGNRADSRVEILTGLEPGEEFVMRSSGDLKDGDSVRLSFISESRS